MPASGAAASPPEEPPLPSALHSGPLPAATHSCLTAGPIPCASTQLRNLLSHLACHGLSPQPAGLASPVFSQADGREAVTQEREVPGLYGITPDPGGPVPTCEHRTRELTHYAPGFRGEVCSQGLGGRGRPSGGVPRWSSWPPGVCTQSCDRSRHVGQECCQPTGMLSAGKGPRVREATEPCNSTNPKTNTFRGTSSRKDFTVMPLKARPRPPSRRPGRSLGSALRLLGSLVPLPQPSQASTHAGGGGCAAASGARGRRPLRPGRGLSVKDVTEVIRHAALCLLA